MSDIDVKLWSEIERFMLNFGSSTKAAQLRHKYINNDLSDDVFAQVYAIIVAEMRQGMDKIYMRHDIDPELIVKPSAERKKTPKRRQPRAKDLATGGAKLVGTIDGYSLREAQQ